MGGWTLLICGGQLLSLIGDPAGFHFQSGDLPKGTPRLMWVP
jgi:hypothetical protein